MFKLNLKIAWRNLWKNKGYTLINILGLSIGMASCILIFIFIRYQMSFDEGFKNEDKIYRIVSTWDYADGNQFYSQGVPLPLTAAIRNDFSPYIEKVAAIENSAGMIKIKDANGKERLKTIENVFYVEPEFFEVFNYNWLSGNYSSLADPNHVVLSKEMANKFFGDWKTALGKSFSFDDKVNYTVSGVIDDVAENNSVPLKIMLAYKSFNNNRLTNWGSVSSSSESYFKLKPNVNIETLNGPLTSFIKKYYVEKAPGKEGHLFQPLADIHYNEKFGNFSGRIMPKKQLYGLVIIGFFLMITASINFINLATAQAVSRSKEVGVRKVMGSQRSQLIIQFLTETLTIVFISLLIGSVLTEIALPGMQNLFNSKISFSIFQHPIIFLFMILLVVLVSLLAGFYPAMIMSGFNPALAIKNKVIANTGGLGLRKILVVVQFTLTVTLIIGTLVILQQMKYVREQPLGFNSSAIAMIDLPNDSATVSRFSAFKAQLKQISSVEEVSFCRTAPSSQNNNGNTFSYNGGKDADFQVNTKNADEDYLKTFDLKLTAGRNLVKSDTINEYLVNETLLKKLNIQNPNEAIGKIISMGGMKAPIVGVIQDFKNKSLHENIDPILIGSLRTRHYYAAVKLNAKEMMGTMKIVSKIWQQTFPESVYHEAFLDDQIKNYYEGERIMGTLFKVFAGVIIFISFIGLFGLISFVATQRTREVAIRKVLGASTMEIVKMLNGSFLLMVFLANLVAWPLAYLFVSKWLAGFAYRIDISIWPFALAMLISMLITLITVSIRSYWAANANTIDALKYE
ncbi:ABC transporter permease [Pedobacter punctiformis]|uniref:ABC transporter permease n=1 Tax=Pedobacter punctiformis TaxID=3004097 RepID=A0ABT4L8W3_9SPHI|nr:ABC transporter permease [Pedobacter sp. HCMS5-2]MCZ4244354.1 ABC transporter permease [Pedobacter sp. HCMS5-2]